MAYINLLDVKTLKSIVVFSKFMSIDNIKFLGFPKKPVIRSEDILPELERMIAEGKNIDGKRVAGKHYPALMVGAGMHELKALAVYLATRHDLAVIPAVKRVAIVEDMPRLDQEYLIGLVKTQEEEVDLLLHGMKEQTDEAYRKDFVEGQQKKSWLNQRLSRPNRGVYTPQTRNRVK